MNLIKTFWMDESGAAMAEYALLISLVTVGTMTAVTTMRNSIIQVYTRAAAELAAAR